MNKIFTLGLPHIFGFGITKYTFSIHPLYEFRISIFPLSLFFVSSKVRTAIGIGFSVVDIGIEIRLFGQYK